MFNYPRDVSMAHLVLMLFHCKVIYSRYIRKGKMNHNILKTFIHQENNFDSVGLAVADVVAGVSVTEGWVSKS